MSGINALVAHFGINFETKEMPQDGKWVYINGQAQPNIDCVFRLYIAHVLFYSSIFLFPTQLSSSNELPRMEGESFLTG